MADTTVQFAAPITGQWITPDGKLQPYVATFLSQLVMHVNQLTNNQTALAEQLTALLQQVNP